MSGRQARCASCLRTVPSDTPHLAFFEDRGPGSHYATEQCRCWMYRTVHQETNPHTGRAGVTDHPFEARGPHEFDAFYCGCRGWD